MLSGFSSPKRDAVEVLHQAFLMLQRIRISYRAENGNATVRIIEPHYLFLSYPVWYVMAWDRLREGMRIFRCDRIESIQILEEDFTLLPLAQFKEKLRPTPAN